MRKPFKFQVQAIVAEYDQSGKIVREIVTDPTVLYGESLTDVAPDYDQALTSAFPQSTEMEMESEA